MKIKKSDEPRACEIEAAAKINKVENDWLALGLENPKMPTFVGEDAEAILENGAWRIIQKPPKS